MTLGYAKQMIDALGLSLDGTSNTEYIAREMLSGALENAVTDNIILAAVLTVLAGHDLDWTTDQADWYRRIRKNGDMGAIESHYR